ncbi:unnamed protein product [Calicophoron daubneyi]|uniref:Fe2OG dioxygenase domain-containing protein n=1 Tax=Calicophoron daubneyi TaxID=300641 RepID=A0AAV2TPE6_CALDB
MNTALRIRWASCRCWSTHNIFLPGVKAHVSYIDRPSFLATYGEWFTHCGLSEADLDEVVSFAEAEKKRREQIEVDMLRNKVNNIKQCASTGKDSFILKKDDFRDEFLALSELSQSHSVPTEDLLSVVEEVEGLVEVYRFPVLTATCLGRINAALDLFEARMKSKSQPNTMNHSGVLLSEIPGSQAFTDGDSAFDCGGADIDLMGSLLCQGLQSVLSRLFPDVGRRLDSYRVFTVQYVAPETAVDNLQDFDLCSHYDNSEVTVNICLSLSAGDEENVGGDLYFVHRSPNTRGGAVTGEPYAKLLSHRPGWAVIHRGSHIHGVLPFHHSSVSPFRRSLICWLRSSEQRSTLCPRCFSSPQLVPMKVLFSGCVVDCTVLSPEEIRSGKFVRAGFADGFEISSVQKLCSVT